MNPSKTLRLAAYRGVALDGEQHRWLTSQDISDVLGINATQIRRDLASISSMGKRGSGYRADRLASALAKEINVKQLLNELGRCVKLLDAATSGTPVK